MSLTQQKQMNILINQLGNLKSDPMYLRKQLLKHLGVFSATGENGMFQPVEFIVSFIAQFGLSDETVLRAVKPMVIPEDLFV